MDEEILSIFNECPGPGPDVAGAGDVDVSFGSSSSSSYSCSSFAATSATFSARSSLSFSSSSSSSSSSSVLRPLPHSSSSSSSSSSYANWSALRAATALSPDGLLRLHHLHLLRPLGSGHLARVFLCRLKGLPPSSPLFALKVADLHMITTACTANNNSSSNSYNDEDHKDNSNDYRCKVSHATAEWRVLSALDHPFLPTLYARLDASHYACFLIDYCAGGDLHSLLRRRPAGRLPPAAARFYAAEVLLALEYLHALGFVYRDLKPENVLLRSDGHVVLSDFDLSFQSHVSPSLRKFRRRSRSRSRSRSKQQYSHVRSSARVFARKHRCRRRARGCCFCGGGGNLMNGDDEDEDEEEVEVEFVAEPERAFSKECVGTHEYLAPEIVSGGGHGNGVDWWAFGVFLYELLYGRTPFKGPAKEDTLRNVLHKELRFPDLRGGDGDGDDETDVDVDDVTKAKDLIRRLLERDPRRRMGSARGAAEVKRHPFFRGINWALIRCVAPPVVSAASAGPTPPKETVAGPGAHLKWSSWHNFHKSGYGSYIRKKKGFFGNFGLGLGLRWGSQILGLGSKTIKRDQGT